MADRVGQHIGNYSLVRLLGKGGFAEVYLAEHLLLKTQVAIKVLGLRLTSEGLESFCSEAQHIASLTHPHIVRLIDFSVDQITPYLVMEYAPNGTLRQRHPEGMRLPLEVVIYYVRQAADGLQYAHDQRLIHRDIKPENLLLGRNNEVLLTDFGLAVVAHTTHSQQFIDVMGTLSYMAPEQIAGMPRRESDQYALAVIVYEWLTGRRPFRGSVAEVTAQQIAAAPLPLRTFAPEIPLAVEHIVFKALAKNPKERFASVQEFANVLEQTSRARSRTGTLPAYPTAPLPAPRSPAQQVPPWPGLRSPTRQLPPLPESSGHISPPTPISHPLERQTTVLKGHSAAVLSIAWSPDGRYLASGGNDQVVRVWDVSSEKAICTYRGHSNAVRTVVWSPDGQYLASGGVDGSVQIWQPLSGQPLLTYRGHQHWLKLGAVQTIAWSPVGRTNQYARIASASHDGTVQIWDSRTGELLLTYKNHSGQAVYTAAWSPDGTYVASGGWDATVQVWHSADGSQIFTHRGHAGVVVAVAWSPDGRQIASAGGDSTAQAWGALQRSKPVTYSGHARGVNTLTWSPDSQTGGRLPYGRIASGSNDSTVQIWDAISGQKLFTYRAHQDAVRAVAWSPDGRRIASSSDDRTVHIWQVG